MSSSPKFNRLATTAVTAVAAVAAAFAMVVFEGTPQTDVKEPPKLFPVPNR